MPNEVAKPWRWQSRHKSSIFGKWYELSDESDIVVCLKIIGDWLEALLDEMKEDSEQRRQWASRRESTRHWKADMECHACHQKGHFADTEDAGPKGGAVKEGTQTFRNGLYLLGRVAGSTVLSGHRIWHVDLGSQGL